VLHSVPEINILRAFGMTSGGTLAQRISRL